MSNLATADRLRRATSQLPVSWYCDPALSALENDVLFKPGPGYVGHELMVPNVGDYYALAWRDNAQALVRSAGGIELLSNVCRHRQAIMLKGRGNAANIVCPLHRWTYDLEGKLLGAPHFDEQPCVKLHSTPLKRWHGLLFDGPRDIASDLAGIGVAADFDFSGYMLDRIEVKECAYNWKTFIEVYLEDYHVGPFHPGLGQFVTTDNLRWQFSDRYSVQTVGVNNA
jgi:phenylpropionate dioxygenase-like ring-hydroxylating dioxygenase large terminal subunit